MTFDMCFVVLPPGIMLKESMFRSFQWICGGAECPLAIYLEHSHRAFYGWKIVTKRQV